jgi:hypothetical protein
MNNEERERQWQAPVYVNGHAFNRPSFGGPRICTYCGYEQHDAEARQCKGWVK